MRPLFLVLYLARYLPDVYVILFSNPDHYIYSKLANLASPSTLPTVSFGSLDEVQDIDWRHACC